MYEYTILISSRWRTQIHQDPLLLHIECHLNLSIKMVLEHSLTNHFPTDFNRRQFYFARVCKELRDYHGTSWHKWKANLKQNYFNTPWAILSMIATVLLLILTIIQTICSIVSVTVKDTPPH